MEEAEGYHGFTDILETFYLERGRQDGEEADGKAGEFKGISITVLSTRLNGGVKMGMFRQLQPRDKLRFSKDREEIAPFFIDMQLHIRRANSNCH